MNEQSRSPLLRRRVLERELSVRGAASVAELCSLLDASPATVRRDLAALEKQGLIKRGYGGASARTVRPPEEALSVREQKNVEAKRAIARRAVGLVKPGETLFLNDGSTVIALARELAAANIEAFVATPAIRLPGILVANPSISICLLGGFMSASSQSTRGPFAEAMVDQINADTAILSPDAFNMQDGLCFMNADDAALARKMTAKSKRRIVLVHGEKFTWRARIAAVPISDIDILVTEFLPDDVAAGLASAGVRSVIADGTGEAEAAPEVRRN